jgi:hypothetical protein
MVHCIAQEQCVQCWPACVSLSTAFLGSPMTSVGAAAQKKHKLRDVSMDDVASWPFADATFGVEFDNVNNVTKLRQVPSATLRVQLP